jgi:multiple sugar transport system permease protein
MSKPNNRTLGSIRVGPVSGARPIAKPAAGRLPRASATRAVPRRRWPLSQIALYFTLVTISILFCLPFLWLVSISLKPPAEVFSSSWIPSEVHTKNYTDVFHQSPVGLWLRNSLLVSVLGAVTVVASSALVAFGFAHLRFRGRTPLFALVMGTYMAPGAVTMVPTFLIWNRLHLVGTFYPLWAGNLFGSAFYIFMLRQFFLTLPRDLIDAARVDGAGFLRIFVGILLPLMKPALIAVALFEFQAKWNDFMTPLIYLNKTSMYTMPLGLASFKTDTGPPNWSLWMAASVIFTLPMIALFFCAQRFFIEGIATTGVKR